MSILQWAWFEAVVSQPSFDFGNNIFLISSFFEFAMITATHPTANEIAATIANITFFVSFCRSNDVVSNDWKNE